MQFGVRAIATLIQPTAVLFVLASTLSTPGAARAADRFWSNAGGGNWNVAANWGGSPPPGVGDVAHIELNGTYTVTVDVNVSVDSLALGAASGTQTLSVDNRTITLATASAVGANGAISLSSSTINGPGTLTNAGGMTIRSSTINAPFNNNALLVVPAGGAIGSPAGTFVPSASSIIRLEGTANIGQGDLVISNGFTNPGLIELTNVSASHDATLTINSGTLVNTGTINVLAGAGGGFRILNLRLDNQGTGQFNINQNTTLNGDLPGTTAHTNAGTINVNADLNWSLGAPDSLANNSPGQITIAAGRTFSLNGGSFNYNAGSLSGSGSLSLSGNTTNLGVAFSNATTGLVVNSSTINGPGTLTNAGGMTIRSSTINAPFNNNALLVVPAGGAIGSPAGTFVPSASSIIRLEGTANIGQGDLVISNGFTNPGLIELTNVSASHDATLTINSGTLVNTGTINVLAGAGGGFRILNLRLDNQGTGQFNINQNTTLNGDLPGTTTHTNAGTINVNADLNWSLGAPDSLSNNSPGQITIAAGRTFTLNGGSLANFASGTLTGGTYTIAGTFRFNAANIATLAANLTLDGSASAILNESNADGIPNLSTVTAAGSFTIRNGRNYARTGGFSNAGQTRIGPGASTLSATGNYVQSSGATTLDGGTLDPANLCDIQAGSLRGSGTIAGDVINAGNAEPGLSAGVLAISGSYTQTAAGSLMIQKGGPTPGIGAGHYDQLGVGGAASLAGALTVSLIDGYQPPVGSTFDIITAASVTGAFDTENLPLIFGGNCKAGPEYAATFVRLTTYQRSIFTESPANQTICSGDPVTFCTVVDGSGPFTYQWRKNLVDIGGATANCYTINAVSPADAGSFDVVVTNICGSETSSSATLTVHIAPVITLAPQPASRCVGQSVSFTVAATGTPAPTYQWQLNGENISGATADTYAIASVSVADAGDYTVVVTNDCGDQVSTPVTLTVNTAPSFSQQPTAAVACVGGMASFTVAAGSSPAPTFRWRKGGVDLNNGGNISGATSTTLTINPVGLADIGAYDCVATNICSSPDSNDAALIVFASGSGDVNGDGLVNGRDVQTFINFLLAGGTPAAGYCAGDMNIDGVVDLPDVPLLTTRLLSP